MEKGNFSRVHKLRAATDSELLLELLAHNRLLLEKTCGGAGICGKCKIKIIDGAVSAPLPEELEHLGKEELQSGLRLACRCRVSGDVSLSLPRSSAEMQIQERGRTFETDLNPAIEKHCIEPAPQKNQSWYSAFLDGVKAVEKTAFNAKNIAHILATRPPQVTTVAFNGQLLGIEAGDTRRFSFGVALDIGTTTVAAELVDISTGKILGTASMINPQFSLGADVLTRIHYAQQQPEHVVQLAALIRSAVNELITDLFAAAGQDSKYCYIITAAGNTTMLHLLLGINPRSLGQSPYRPVFLEPLRIKALDVDLQASPFAFMQCLPGVSGFIGADIASGLIALNLFASDSNILFLDMGTNGEIILCANGRMIAASTAAGPALEGMNISCGMKACSGAIERVVLSNSNLAWETIGAEPPLGLCGSGLLDLVAALLQKGVILPSGRIVPPEKAPLTGVVENNGSRRFQVIAPSSENTSGVYLSQQDVRQVQLAKGALTAGIKLLLTRAGVEESGVKTVYLAGGFGAYLNCESLITLGLFPKSWNDRIVYVGNTSLAGARLCLLNHGLIEDNMEDFEHVEHFDLNASPHFNKIFSRAMSFCN